MNRVSRLTISAWMLSIALWMLPAQGLDLMLMGEVDYAVSRGEFSTAVERLEQALEAAPHRDLALRADLYRRLAEVHEAAKEWRHAAEAWLRVAELTAAQRGEQHPELAVYYEHASLAYEKAGDPQAALESGAKAFAIDGRLLDRHDESLQAPRQRLRELAEAVGDRQAMAAYRPPPRLRSATPSAPAEVGHPGPLDVMTADYGNVDESYFTRVRVYYGTDREPSGSRRPGAYFSGERGELSFGTVDVSVPRNHKPGAIEKPSLMTLTVRENPERHMVLLELRILEGEEALRQMREELNSRDSDEAFVFVHGYNVSFADAARRTAQIAYDTNFEGLPIMYSWPSRASTLDYIADTAVVRHSGRRLTRFLQGIVDQSGAERIHLIAHSMGSRALSDALELFALRHAGAEVPAFDQIIFAAPDVDSGLFADMVRTFRPVARRVTLYTSEHDTALSTSRRLHGSRPRAGQGGADILVVEGLDTVDMSSLGEDLLRHSYFANDASALTDLVYLFTLNRPPARRCGLMNRPAAIGQYWAFDPESCDGNVILSALTILREQGLESAESHAQSMLEAARARGVERAMSEWQQITEEVRRLVVE